MKINTKFKGLSCLLTLIINGLIVFLLAILIHIIMWWLLGEVKGDDLTIRNLYILLFLVMFDFDEIIEVDINQEDE